MLVECFEGLVSLYGLWKVLSRLQCPLRFLAIFRQLHDSQMSQAMYYGSLTESVAPFQTASSKGVSTAFSEAAKTFGLTISLKRLNYFTNLSQVQPTSLRRSSLMAQPLTQSSIISNDTAVTKDQDNRQSNASSSFGSLSKKVWHLAAPLSLPIYHFSKCTELSLCERSSMVQS